jgi:hypothetical protein
MVQSQLKNNEMKWAQTRSIQRPNTPNRNSQRPMIIIHKISHHTRRRRNHHTAKESAEEPDHDQGCYGLGQGAWDDQNGEHG